MELSLVGAPKLYHEISLLKEHITKFVTAEQIERMTQDVKQFRTTIADTNYELQMVKDLSNKNEKLIDLNQKDVKELINKQKLVSEGLDQR